MRYEYRTNEITEALIKNGDAVSEHGAAHIHELVKHVSNLQSRIAELEQDNQEQCRLNAMGADREARLMARVNELEKDAARYRWLRGICGIVEYKDAFGSIGPGMLPSGENLDASIDTAMKKD